MNFQSGETYSGNPPPDSVDIFYFHNDHLGTSWFMTNESQMVVWAMDYYPFGEVYDEVVSLLNNHRFPGQYLDRTTNLNYNWHRYYLSELGRYYQADPIGLNEGVSHFAKQWTRIRIALLVSMRFCWSRDN